MKAHIRRESLLAFIGLALILTVAFSLNLLLVAEDKRPPSWDYADYLYSSIRAYDAAIHGSLHQLMPVLSDPYRPPLIPLSALPFYFLFGISYQSAMMMNLLYLTVLVIFTYKLTKISHSAEVALAAAGIVWAIPGVMAYDRVYGLDFPLTALVSAGLYLTATCKGFSSRWRSAALGVVVGLGLLTKWSYFVFVAPMIAMELIQHRKAIKISNVFAAGFLVAVVSSPWYISALKQGLIQRLIYYAWGEGAIGYGPSGGLFDITALLFYPQSLYKYEIGPVFLVPLLLISTAALLQVRKFIRRSMSNVRSLVKSLALSFLVALLVFTLVVDKGPRFFLPVVPCLLVLLVWAGSVWRIRGVRIGAILIVGVVITGSLLNAVGALQPVVGARIGIYEPYTVADSYFGYNDYSPPKGYDWKVEAILTTIVDSNSRARVGMLTNHWVFNQDTFYYYALRLGFTGLSFYDFRDVEVHILLDSLPKGRDAYSLLNDFDFVLKKSGDLGDTNAGKAIVQRLSNMSDPFYKSFDLIRVLDLPDGSKLSIFMKMPSTNQPPLPSQNSLMISPTPIMARYIGTQPSHIRKDPNMYFYCPAI